MIMYKIERNLEYCGFVSNVFLLGTGKETLSFGSMNVTLRIFHGTTINILNIR